MTKIKKDRAPRVQKTIKAVLDNGTGLVENISTSGGFLKLEKDFPTTRFHLDLKLSEFKTVKMACDPQWHNQEGVGFKVLEIQKAKGFCIVSEKGKVVRIPETFLGPLNYYHEIKD